MAVETQIHHTSIGTILVTAQRSRGLPRFYLYSAVVEVEDQNVLRTDLHELVHDVRHLALLDHHTHRNPSVLL